MLDSMRSVAQVLASAPDKIETWILSAPQLQSQFDRVAPGTVIVYAVGDLGYERQATRGWQREYTDDAANLAYSLAKQGLADVTQKRLGPHKHEYWLTKR
jgi:hypothetical protein